MPVSEEDELAQTHCCNSQMSSPLSYFLCWSCLKGPHSEHVLEQETAWRAGGSIGLLVLLSLGRI